MLIVAAAYGEQPVTGWENLASGVWRARIGDTSSELAYTALSGRPPRIDKINTLGVVEFPFSPGAVTASRSKDGLVQVRIPAPADESLYGFGLQLDGIRQSGRVLTLNVDHWDKGEGRTHAPVPFYISSRGYGVLFNTARFLKVYAQVGNRKGSPANPEPVDRNPPPEEPAQAPWNAQPASDGVEASLHADGLEIIVFAGRSLQDVVARYNLYCGGGVLPPLWGLGFWHRVPAWFTAAQVEIEVESFARRDFPLDVIGLEPGWMTKSYPCTYEWQRHRFPDPAAFVRGLLDRGIRLNLWLNPYISPKAGLYDTMYPLSGSHLVWLGLVPDYTLPAARQALRAQHESEHLSIGVSGYKIDEVDGYDRWLWPTHATFPSGTSGETMRQSYGLLLQSFYQTDMFRARNQRTYSQVRSSNAGASSLPFVLYSDSYDMKEYVTGLSAASLSGLLWGPEARHAETPEEWRARLQLVSFSPMAKLNAWAHEARPWDYASVADDVRDVVRLRSRLLPYLYSSFARYEQEGIPPIRAMILEENMAQPNSNEPGPASLEGGRNPYAEATRVSIDDQFMFGPSIMVAPYYGQNLSSRQVRLPAGDWYDFYTGDFAGNDTTITVSSPERTPLFVKDGAVIPLLEESVVNTRDAIGKNLIVRHYGKSSGSFSLYEDDGSTFDYELGANRQRLLTVSEGQHEEIITQATPVMFGKIVRWEMMLR